MHEYNTITIDTADSSLWMLLSCLIITTMTVLIIICDQ